MHFSLSLKLKSEFDGLTCIHNYHLCVTEGLHYMLKLGRVLFDGGWGLIRASNTQPVLVLRFEAEDENRLEEIRTVFMEKLERELR